MENNQNKNLVLIDDLGYKYPKQTSKEKRHYAKYKCYCGNEFDALTDNIKKGNTTSCGCHKKEIITKHGLVNHRLYKIWQGILQRCLNSKSIAYKKYGLRGIIICKEWDNDFMSFYNWALENGYSDNLSIDRIDNDGNYEPSNCRWTTKIIQAQNTTRIRINNTSGYRGVTWSREKKKWKARININKKEIHIGYFKNIIEAAQARDTYIINNNLEHTRNFS